MKDLNKILKKAIDFQKELEITVISRSIYFDEKSDRWQETDTGESYRMETTMLEDLNIALLSAIDDLTIATS